MKTMGSNVSTSILLAFFLLLGISLKAQDGESIFKTTCAACHKVTSQRLVGPGLANIHEKRTKEWFKKFVKSSQSLIKSGDADALKVFEDNNRIIMPDQALSDSELDALFNYIKSKSPVKSNDADVDLVLVEEVEIPFKPTKEDILIGQNLFSGKQKFVSGGPSCISCHHVRKDDMIAGGTLAKDLTDVYDRLKKAGIEGMISGLPFPQMKISYQDHQITEEETIQLVAFFKEASEERYYQRYGSYTSTFLIWGGTGALILMGIFPLFWYKRKKETVNKRIYDRQIKSRN